MLTDFRDHSHGFVIVLEQETPYRALVFASSDYHDAARRPRLELVFDGSTPVHPAMAPETIQLEIYPNPASEQADVRAILPPGQYGSMELLDAAGRLLRSWEEDGAIMRLMFNELDQLRILLVSASGMNDAMGACLHSALP